MRWLIRLVVLAAVLWAGWWFAGATAINRGVAEATAQGPLAASDAIVRGFPNRWDLTLTEPRFADPRTGLRWQAPFVQVFALTYRPWHLVAALPPEQVIDTPMGSTTLRAGRMQASLVLHPSADLPLERFALVGDEVELVRAPFAAAPSTTRARVLRLATRRAAGDPLTHEVGLDLAGLAPDPALLAAIPAEHGLPAEIEALRLVVSLSLSAPVDRHLPDRRPVLTALDLSEVQLAWGSIRFTARGRLVPDAEGYAEGTLQLALDDWEAAFDAAGALGLMEPQMVPTWSAFARSLAEAAGTPGRLELPLTLSGGRMSLGPLPLGRAPLLVAPAG